jgi:putative ABC transport system ATP-binding protein
VTDWVEFDLVPVDPVAEAAVAVRCTNLVHVYGEAGSEVAALRGIDLEVRAGEMVALLGPSGSGKSTLLWQLAGLLRPTAGTVEVGGQALSGLSAADLADLRLREIGIVLQSPARNLLGHLSAADNVVLVQRPTRRTPRAQHERAMGLLDAVGLADHAGRVAGRLSGGEQQRLAIAVALANGPRLLLADEPTSHLDTDSAAAVIELIRAANADLGTTVIAVTHDSSVGAALGRTLTIRDGLIGMTTLAGEDYLVVGRGGNLQLPADLLDALPPGSRVRARRTADGILLQPADDDLIRAVLPALDGAPAQVAPPVAQDGPVAQDYRTAEDYRTAAAYRPPTEHPPPSHPRPGGGRHSRPDEEADPA